MQKRKRKLTEVELKEIREWMDGASQENKPTIRQIARRYGVNQPSVVKSLGGWDGIRRGKPDPAKKSKFAEELSKPGHPIEIEGYTTNIDEDKLNI